MDRQLDGFSSESGGNRQSVGYLLRFWKDGEGDSAWRASLTDVRSRETCYFGTITSLIEHLKEVVLT